MQSSLLLSLNARMASSPTLTTLIPILSDIFVFWYPVYLVYLYFFTTEHLSRRKKIFHISHNRLHKYNALSIFWSTVGVFLVNYIIKTFIQQPRPYDILNLTINPKESLILHSLPTDSFPSDHAAVGIAIALTLLILWYRQQDKKMILTWRVFIVFALTMNICRITIGVHRPTDILGGTIIGIIVAILSTNKTIFNRCVDTIYNPLITFQEKVFALIKQ